MFNPCRTPHHHKDTLGNGLGGVPQAASVLSNPPKPCPLQIHVEIAGTYLPAVWSYRKQVSWNKILFVQHFSSMWKYGLCDKDSEQDIHSTIFNRNQIKCLLAAGISMSSRIAETLPFCIEPWGQTISIQKCFSERCRNPFLKGVWPWQEFRQLWHASMNHMEGLNAQAFSIP